MLLRGCPSTSTKIQVSSPTHRQSINRSRPTLWRSSAASQFHPLRYLQCPRETSRKRSSMREGPRDPRQGPHLCTLSQRLGRAFKGCGRLAHQQRKSVISSMTYAKRTSRSHPAARGVTGNTSTPQSRSRRHESTLCPRSAAVTFPGLFPPSPTSMVLP